MFINPVQEPYLLPGTENQLLFSEEIVPDAFDETAPAVAPKAIFLGGQSGSGKSGLAKFILSSSFSAAERAVIINSDALREFHPDFAKLQRSNPQQASFLVNPDTVIWQQKLIDVAVKTRRNLLLDGTLGGTAEPIIATMTTLRQAGYSVQISVLAVPARLSRFGIYKRYEDQLALKGSGRWVGMANHDRQYEEIPATLTRLQTDNLTDQILLYSRSENAVPSVRYDSRLTNMPVAQALTKLRNQPLNPNEQTAFAEAVGELARTMQQRGASQQEIADFYRYVAVSFIHPRPVRPDDLRLYFDWANDPGTRQQSFSSDPISLETHTAWFTRKLADPNALLLVFENETGEPVGQVRFEQSADEVIVGVSVDAQHRGKGLASQLIKQGCAVCREQWGAVTIHAYVKPDNRASARAFERAGFTLSDKSGKFVNPGGEVPSLVYRKTLQVS